MFSKTNEIAQRILNSKGKKMIQIMNHIKAKNSSVAAKEIEQIWESIGGRKVSHTTRKGKRINDNTVRNLMNEMVELNLLQRSKTEQRIEYSLSDEFLDLDALFKVENDFTELIRWSNTFSKYKGLPFFEDLNELLSEHPDYEELITNWNSKETQPIIDFETNQRIFSGWKNNTSTYDITEKVADLLFLLYRIIAFNQETIEFSYRSFQNERTQTISDCEPYFLKEHNKRWYLVAKPEGLEPLRVFSLDRIIEISEGYTGRKYRIDKNFNPHAYFSDAIGVFIDHDYGSQAVSFELKDGPRFKNRQFLISSPLHHSQKSIRIDDQWTRFEFKVHIGPELVRSIRQWGIHNVRNIKPDQLESMIHEG
jgi:hypothetical protein